MWKKEFYSSAATIPKCDFCGVYSVSAINTWRSDMTPFTVSPPRVLQKESSSFFTLTLTCSSETGE